MTSPELQQILDVSPAHSAVVSVSQIPDIPGLLRVVTIHSTRRVSIEFLTVASYLREDWEGGHLKYTAQYKTLDKLIADLETFLSASITTWNDIKVGDLVTTELASMTDYEPSLRLLEEKVRVGTIDVPLGSEYEIATVYWRHIKKYGEYREDKLFEEQEDRYRHLEEEPEEPS